MMMKKIVHICTFCFVVLISAGAVTNPISNIFIQKMKKESEPVWNHQNPLLEQVIEQKERYEERAIDARIDKVWKAVPGYNGIEIDVQASYDKMKRLEKFDENKLVFKEISPSIHLEDLPVAPIYRGNEEKPMVTFLINVAWGNEHIPEMLKVLNKHHIHTTFFLDGSWVKKNRHLATMIMEEGHEIGNHAYSHPNMAQLTMSRINEEIVKTNEIIEATINVSPKWFAPPSGSFNQTVVDQAALHGMKTVLWTVDTIDWRNPEQHVMTERVLSQVHNGAMILMHPTEVTARSLETLITEIEKKGLFIGTVSELLSEKRISMHTALDSSRGISGDQYNNFKQRGSDYN